MGPHCLSRPRTPVLKVVAGVMKRVSLFAFSRWFTICSKRQQQSAANHCAIMWVFAFVSAGPSRKVCGPIKKPGITFHRHLLCTDVASVLIPTQYPTSATVFTVVFLL